VTAPTVCGWHTATATQPYYDGALAQELLRAAANRTTADWGAGLNDAAALPSFIRAALVESNPETIAAITSICRRSAARRYPRGRPRPRLAMMLRCTSEVPPRIVAGTIPT
jgi:hypothetical protein